MIGLLLYNRDGVVIAIPVASINILDVFDSSIICGTINLISAFSIPDIVELPLILISVDVIFIPPVVISIDDDSNGSVIRSVATVGILKIPFIVVDVGNVADSILTVFSSVAIAKFVIDLIALFCI